MARVSLNRLAERELNEAYGFYEDRRPGLGERFLQQVEALTRLLVDHPGIGAPIAPNVRRVPVPDFPYNLIYRPLDDGRIRILATAHKRRRPGHWVGRR